MNLKIDQQNFLDEYWQQKPLLIRNALPNFKPAIDANELAGLALEDFVESRIVETLPESWALHHGPFLEADFDRKPPWTLLVQAVDHYVQEVAELLKLVNFIPNWRADDVMVSYAVDGASVGPHYDNYDVFLLQGEGTRLWKLGQQCNSASALLPHDELRILEHFKPTEQYLLGPGDMLYVPPGLAHWGIAQGECTTFSLGFRAPRVNDMLSRWVDSLLETIDPELFYTDAGQSATHSAGEIRTEDMARVNQLISDTVNSRLNKSWFGELVTEPRYSQALDEDELRHCRRLLREGMSRVTLLPASKLAWQREGDNILVFANGTSTTFTGAVLPTLMALCDGRQLEGEPLQQGCDSEEKLALINHLLVMACIVIE